MTYNQELHVRYCYCCFDYVDADPSWARKCGLSAFGTSASECLVFFHSQSNQEYSSIDILYF